MARHQQFGGGSQFARARFHDRFIRAASPARALPPSRGVGPLVSIQGGTVSGSACFWSALALIAALGCAASPRPSASGATGEAQQVGGGRAAFLASYADSWLDVRDGAVDRTTRAAVQPGVAEYLRGMRFLEVSDVSEPVIEVSAGGTMAWLVSEVRVRAVQARPDGTERPVAFRAAWLSTYAKRGGTWVQVATANTMRDGA